MHTGWHLDKKSGPKWLKRSRIWREFAEKGFWTAFFDDWDLSKWAFKTKGKKHRLLFIVYCLFVYHLLFIIYCLLFVYC